MSTAARYDDRMRFVIHPNDHNPPHVHVKLQNGDECRINLISGEFMDSPPAGMRRIIKRRYLDNIEDLFAEWEKYHPDRR